MSALVESGEERDVIPEGDDPGWHCHGVECGCNPDPVNDSSYDRPRGEWLWVHSSLRADDEPDPHDHACCPPGECCGGPCAAHPCWELTT